jgi:hypothetical protein
LLKYFFIFLKFLAANLATRAFLIVPRNKQVKPENRFIFLITKPTILNHDSHFHLHTRISRHLRRQKNLCLENPNGSLTKKRSPRTKTPRRIGIRRGVVSFIKPYGG